MLYKDCDKLIQLYWDQQLDEKKRKEVEKHLSECQRCKEKLEALKIIEEKAKRIKIPEPGEAYWKSFSQRVREKIISKQKRPFGHKIKEFFANIPAFSPSRLKVAAAIASFILVFIVGKLYIDYRGTIPERIKYAEKEIPEVKEPEIEKEIAVPVPEETAPPRGQKKRIVAKAPEIRKGKIKDKKEQIALEEKAEPKDRETGAGAELMAKKATPRDIVEKAPIPEVMEQEVSKPVEKAESRMTAMRTLADAQDTKAKTRSKVSCEFISQLDKYWGDVSDPHMYRCLLPDSTWVPDVDWARRNLSADSLRVIINVWRKFIKENPEDPFVEQAYLQIAASYYYLFDKTKDDSIRVESIKHIEEFLKMSKEEETRKSLKQRLEKLKGSKEK